MIDVVVYDLPTKESSPRIIEKKLVELITRHRNNEHLDDVELCWMDSANNWLTSA